MNSVGDRLTSDEIIRRINVFIRNNTRNTHYNGSFVFVGRWSDVPPFPAGTSPEDAKYYENIVSKVFGYFFISKTCVTQTNTYQAVLTTDGEEKSFAIFIYKCGTLKWSRPATIGFNAGGNYYANHPISGSSFSNAIACLNRHSVWNNVLYDLTDSIQSGSGLVNSSSQSREPSNISW